MMKNAVYRGCRTGPVRAGIDERMVELGFQIYRPKPAERHVSPKNQRRGCVENSDADHASPCRNGEDCKSRYVRIEHEDNDIGERRNADNVLDDLNGALVVALGVPGRELEVELEGGN